MVNIPEKLQELSSEYSKKDYLCDYFYTIKIEGDEIELDHSVSLGWNTLYSFKKLFNACDWPTNRENAMIEIMRAENLMIMCEAQKKPARKN